MPTIILARHGKLARSSWTSIPGRALAEWREGAESVPLDPARQPSPELLQLAEAVPLLIASPLRRSLDSAHRLRPLRPPLIEPLVREVESRPAFDSGLRLPAKVWGLAARAAWYAGRSSGAESYPAARERARAVADRLAALACAQGQILVIGHGIMNGLIGKRLRERRWDGPSLPPHRHWSFAIYRREAEAVTQ